MTTAIADPTETLKDLLKNNWNPANITGSLDIVTTGTGIYLSTGWYTAGNEYPQLCVPHSGFAENPTSASGYNAMTPSGPSQFLVGQQLVVAFAHWKMDVSNSPKELTWEMAREAKRIVHANANALSDFFAISPGGLDKDLDAQKDPVLFNAQFFIGWTRFEDP